MVEQAGSMARTPDEPTHGVLDPDLLHVPDGPSSASAASLRTSSRYALGLLLLVLVVGLWVASSTLIQVIFVDMKFNSPFFLTFYSTSLFTLYLPIYAVRQLCRRYCTSERSRLREGHTRLATTGAINLEPHPPTSDRDATGQRSPHRVDVLSADDFAEGEGAAAKMRSAASSHVADGIGEDEEDAEAEAASESAPLLLARASPPPGAGSHISPVGVPPLSVGDTAKLALFLCPIWFSMNYAFNASLNLTSIASSTILSTTASLFVLAFSYLLDPTTHIRAQQVVGVMITIGGVCLISLKDTQMPSPGETDVTSASAMMHPLTGDIIAVCGSIFYGLYTVLLKLRIPHEDAVEMQLLFGFLGLFNTIIFWPGFFLVAAVGLEPLVSPPPQVLLFLTVNGIFGTVISDFLWAKSVLLTSPLIASLGLALTIPLAIVVDWLLHDLHFTPVYFVGGLCVLFGFGLVNLVHSKAIRAEEAEAEQRSLQTSPRIPADILSALRLDDDDDEDDDESHSHLGLREIQLTQAFDEGDTLADLTDDQIEFSSKRPEASSPPRNRSPAAYL